MSTNDDLYSQQLGGLTWRKSTYSNPHNCVEVAHLPGGAVAMRDSKHPDRAPLRFTPSEWDAFIQGAAAGEF